MSGHFRSDLDGLFALRPVCFITVLLFAAAARCAETNFAPLVLAGETFIHDPSTVVKDNGRFYIFGTGPGIRTKSSLDLIQWTNGESVFSVPPSWTTKAVPGFNGYIWAPDVIRLNGRFYLYYSVSTWGKQVSAIGLATSPTLDATATNYFWKDCGAVIQSNTNSPFNAIDPSVMLDTDGKLWLAFGSYWRGIYLTQLDSRTGLRVSTNSPLHRIAWNDSIEAACLSRHGNFYYLFVNWGQCCRGTNSTYELRTGRSRKVTGPYLDRDGKDLVAGGGSLFLKTNGQFIGPGHVAVFDEAGTNWFSYHYYDAETRGRSRLALGKLRWTDDGWPVAAK